MSTFTLTIGKQSISFSVDELGPIQTVLFDAARKPGHESFRGTSSHRIAATLSDGRSFESRQNLSGTHRFNDQSDSGVILTEF
jgi:hypothetical protein